MTIYQPVRVIQPIKKLGSNTTKTFQQLTAVPVALSGQNYRGELLVGGGSDPFFKVKSELDLNSFIQSSERKKEKNTSPLC